MSEREYGKAESSADVPNAEIPAETPRFDRVEKGSDDFKDE